MLSGKDTIVACSSPPGRGAISIIRLSGDKAFSIIQKITKNKLKKQISVVKFPLEKGLIEKCVLTIFRSPNSYTGEDIVEISTHGNPYIVESVIKKCLDSGAKIAKPGEFTLRAYLNNKLSLDQSEAVIDIINANSKASLKAAQNSLEGGLKAKISEIQHKLRETRVLVETLIDFIDEDVNIYIEEVLSKIDEFKRFFASFNEDMQTYSTISNDVKVVVIGPPNSGKSTLININSGAVIKTSGKVCIWGLDIDKYRKQSKLAVGVVPQELNIDAFFTPKETLNLHSGMFNVPKNNWRTNELLKLMDLTDKAEIYSRKLSGGMRRRLLVAKAMVHSPPIIILDEPTAGVDVELRQNYGLILKN